MLLNLLPFVGLLAAPLGTARLIDGATTRTHQVWFSHLSPVVSYSPGSPTDDAEAGWNVTLRSHRTTNNNASIQWSYFGRGFEAGGNGSALEVAVDGAQDRRQVSRASNDNIDFSMVNTFLPFDDVGAKEASIKTNGSDESFMDVTQYRLETSLPADEGFLAANNGLGVAEHMSATDVSSGFYLDESGAWEIREPPVNQTTGVQFNWAWDRPPSFSAEYPYNSSVLSTDQVGEPLRLTVPPYTSLFQWYGTVGPDQGRYELRLIPTSSGDIQFQPFPLNQSYTGERAVNSIYETKAIAYLDPRATYDVEIELQEEGKRTDLHGISFWRYTDIDAEIGDWYDESSGGLSGGQIAGIVVGSVAGAALIGLAIWYFMRRRNRSKSAAPTPGKTVEDRTESPA